ncbi:MAG: hypothetical protein J3K34DRAFT_173940 [Monoraphidium minutum]|nr:MAG: hypothetical protein J3K34DRAFT_173940 [Monoraphidium minutum]
MMAAMRRRNASAWLGWCGMPPAAPRGRSSPSGRSAAAVAAASPACPAIAAARAGPSGPWHISITNCIARRESAASGDTTSAATRPSVAGDGGASGAAWLASRSAAATRASSSGAASVSRNAGPRSMTASAASSAASTGWAGAGIAPDAPPGGCCGWGCCRGCLARQSPATDSSLRSGWSGVGGVSVSGAK